MPNTAQSSEAICMDPWDIVARGLHFQSYNDFLQYRNPPNQPNQHPGALQSTATFLNRSAPHPINTELVARLQVAEQSLRRQGITTCPSIDSTLRERKSMHGFGMALDFDVVNNPYVLNEAGEGRGFNDELLGAYDHIADFMLGDAQSKLHNLAGGRRAFGGTIAGVYDALRRESDAMMRYFSFRMKPEVLTAYLANEWANTHPGQAAPDLATIQSQIQEDYAILGGNDVSGHKRPTNRAGVDRPFAPSSSGGRGDPANGFLNLDRDLVLALTDAGLAWGAIDMGGASGDIQHFDCRLSCLGAQVGRALHLC